MVFTRLLTKRQLVAALAYSMIFPLTNLAGGSAMFVGILLTMPFLPLAWVGGMILVSVAGEKAFLYGAFITVLAQVLLLFLGWSAVRPRHDAEKP